MKIYLLRILANIETYIFRDMFPSYETEKPTRNSAALFGITYSK